MAENAMSIKESEFSSGDFRKALGSFTTGVTVVTTKGVDGADTGLTANSFNSVSLDPPMILWSLAKSSLSLPAFTAAKHFAVHILSSEQQMISARFAKRGADKFAELDIERGPDDIPLLPDCAARFVCETAYCYEGGDHIIFVGRVVRFDHWDRSPLLFHSGQYGRLLKAQGDVGNSDFNDDFLGHLLRRCYQKVYAPVRAELEKLGFSRAQYYVLAEAAQRDTSMLDDVRKSLELSGRYASDNEIQTLMDRDLIARDGELFKLTARGNQTYIELATVIKAAESDAEHGLDYDLRQTLKIALLKMLESESSDVS